VRLFQGRRRTQEAPAPAAARESASAAGVPAESGRTEVDPQLLELLRCPRCNNPLTRHEPGLSCTAGHLYPVREGIPLLWADGEDRNALEEIDYDAVHAIGSKAVEGIGDDWARLLADIGHAAGDVLEIGAGTGALTKGLLAKASPRSLVVTDVSERFLVPLVTATRGGPVPVHGVAFDTNTNVFREEAFDTIVGRSVLHHLLDYADVLAVMRQRLREGGILVVFEPVLHGKTILSLLLGIVLRAHDEGWQTVLSEDERSRLQHLLRHQTKSGWHPQDRDSLARLNDKYIFDVEDLLALARRLGYSRAEFREVGETDPSYWPYFRHTLAVAGVSREKLPALKWVCDVFGETYGLVLPHRLTRPMGYFVLGR